MKVTQIRLEPTLRGAILDIGGGGEGIIGRLYGGQVTAIDRSREELEEAPDGFEKLLMDATDLQFEAGRFDHVTFFYTLMYMTGAEQQKAIGEAARVLRAGGDVLIWDHGIDCAWPEPFLAELDILLSDRRIRTAYGIVKEEGQSRSSVADLCAQAGLILAESAGEGGSFYLRFEKPE